MSKVRIAFTGDIMCSAGVTEMFTDKNGIIDYTPALRNLRNDIRGDNDNLSADLLVGNLETPIAGKELGFTSERYCFNTPDEFAVMLKDIGFDLLCLANNHCMDRGEAGIEHTLDTLDRIGIAHTGIYRKDDIHKPCVLKAGNIRVSIINYTYGTNAFAHHRFLDDIRQVNLFQPQETQKGSIHLLETAEFIAAETDRLYGNPSDDFDMYIKPHFERLQADISAAKNVSDFTVVVMHSGGQYNKIPDAYTKMLAECLSEMGADCVIGHHPHVIQPYEKMKGVPVFYSLGNLYCLPSICQDVVGASYSALPVLTLEKHGEKTTLTECDFIITRTIENFGEPPCCVNSYDLYESAPSVELRKEILTQVEKFNGKATTEISRIYRISL